MVRLDKRVYYINTIYCMYIYSISIYTSIYTYLIYQYIYIQANCNILYILYIYIIFILYVYIYLLCIYSSLIPEYKDGPFAGSGQIQNPWHWVFKVVSILCRSTSNHDATSTAAEDRDGSRHGPSVLTMGILIFC